MLSREESTLYPLGPPRLRNVTRLSSPTNAVRLVQKILAVAGSRLRVLIDRNHDRLNVVDSTTPRAPVDGVLVQGP
jgi:hypothetical protein